MTGEAQTPLEVELKRQIELEGPISVSRFMSLCLGHPRYGYYITRDPFGAAGDFTTAPEITQMFGELIGLWAAAVWRDMGEPAALHLVELGPGRGTLMADALRAGRVMPGFLQAIDIHLVETSPVLRQAQGATLEPMGATLTWHTDLDSVPDGPALIIANEFFDALPIFQAVRQLDGWHERVVGLDANGALAFGLDPDPIPHFLSTLPETLHDAALGALYEWRSDHVVMDMARRVTRQGGAALILDYGHTESGPGETLQALRGHVFVDPLTTPGEADLTAHVDFDALATAATVAGARVHGPLEQGTFLKRLGMERRAETLKASATIAQAAAIEQAYARLTDMSVTGMGRLFKALAITGQTHMVLPGFDPPQA
jgi:SAM-dependent MidA family methyltransferase